MKDTVNRFIDNTLRHFLRKEYSVEEVLQNPTWREKAQLLREKKDELEEIKYENSDTIKSN